MRAPVTIETTDEGMTRVILWKPEHPGKPKQIESIWEFQPGSTYEQEWVGKELISDLVELAEGEDNADG